MKRTQPSNLTLLVTAAACASVLAWAYRDRLTHSQVERAQVDPVVETPELVPLESDTAAWPAPPERELDAPPFERPEPASEAAAPRPAPEIYRLPLPDDRTQEAPPPAQGTGLANVALWPTLPPLGSGPADEPTALVSNAPSDDDARVDHSAGEDGDADKSAERTPRLAHEQATDSASEAPRELSSAAVELDPEAHYLGQPLKDEAAKAAAKTPRDELLSYTPAATGISERVADDVRSAFSLGRHGALYAARERFVDAMRVIAASKDAAASTDEHSLALTQGLAALDEAEDFLPRGDALEADLSVAEIAASHRTPMLHGAERRSARLPHEAAALYYRYAEEKLAMAVGGEQAGSMALYGLGKSYARLADLDESPAAEQRSLAMYRAALVAHRANHLAANELGVGLARAGRYEQAAQALRQSVAMGGGSTVYRNLAHVQRELGQARLAAATAQHAERLAIAERQAGAFSRERGVEWISPDRFAQHPGATGAAAQRPSSPPEANATASASPWRSVVRFAKRIVGETPLEAPGPRVGANPVAPPAASRTTIR